MECKGGEGDRGGGGGRGSGGVLSIGGGGGGGRISRPADMLRPRVGVLLADTVVGVLWTQRRIYNNISTISIIQYVFRFYKGSNCKQSRRNQNSREDLIEKIGRLDRIEYNEPMRGE